MTTQEKMTTQDTGKKPMNKRALFGVIALIVAVAVLAGSYLIFKPKTKEGAKTVALVVVSADQQEQSYEVHTDALYLQQVMDEAKGLTYSGTDSEFGMMVDTVNDEKASYEVDGAYWSFYVNEEYCNYGIGQQPVEDGDEFKIVYTID